MNHRKKVNDLYKDKGEKGKWQQHNALVHARTIVHIHARTELSVHACDCNPYCRLTLNLKGEI